MRQAVKAPSNEKYLDLLTDVTLQVFTTFDSLLAEDSTFIKRGTYSPPGRIQQGFILIRYLRVNHIFSCLC